MFGYPINMDGYMHTSLVCLNIPLIWMETCTLSIQRVILWKMNVFNETIFFSNKIASASCGHINILSKENQLSFDRISQRYDISSLGFLDKFQFPSSMPYLLLSKKYIFLKRIGGGKGGFSHVGYYAQCIWMEILYFKR